MRLENYFLSVLMVAAISMIHLPPETNLEGIANEQKQESFRPLEQVEFHYLIYKDAAYDFGRPETAMRQIRVFMDEKAFSEENLKKLFAVLSHGYPDPDFLTVLVITNL